MRIIARKALREFWEYNPRAERPLQTWYRNTKRAIWRSPADVKAQFRSASFVGDKVVFNIGGNTFRLVVKIEYRYQAVYIRFVGTHSEYDKIDVRAL